MPIARVRGIDIAFEILGDSGPPVVLTSGGMWAIDREFMRPLAESLSASFRVLIYDRRNTGESSIAFEEEQSIVAEYVDDLHELLVTERMTPSYVGGCSGGTLVSLLYAHRYPTEVRGLVLLWPPSDAQGIYDDHVKVGFHDAAFLAETEGMQAVVGSDSVTFGAWKLLAERNQKNREQLTLMDAAEFASNMRRGAKLFMSNAHFAGLSESQVRDITNPAIVLPGPNEVHPLRAGEMLQGLLPNSCLVNPADHFPPDITDALQRVRNDEQMDWIARIGRKYPSTHHSLSGISKLLSETCHRDDVRLVAPFMASSAYDSRKHHPGIARYRSRYTGNTSIAGTDDHSTIRSFWSIMSCAALDIAGTRSATLPARWRITLFDAKPKSLIAVL